MQADQPPERRITLKDLAEAAGLSTATVSKALNARSDVSTDTQLRVRRLAADLGYVNSTATTTSVYPHLALVSDTLETMYTLEFLNGASLECISRGFAMTTTHLFTDTLKHRVFSVNEDWVRKLAANGYIGLIMLTTDVDVELQRLTQDAGLPLVAVDPRTPAPPGVPSIGATNWRGGRDAISHLIHLGHRRIAFVGGPPESVPSNERYEGYISAHISAGIQPDPALRAGENFTFTTGLEVGRAMLSRPSNERPTAFFAGSDWSALGVIEAVREQGLRVPDDISVVGFDDTVLATSSSPQLTTIRQPLREMGSLAVRSIAMMHDGQAPSGPVSLNTELILRGSTAAPPTIA